MTTSNQRTPFIQSEDTKKIYQKYTTLSTDDKLALLYFIYEDMGEAITPAAPNAANLNIASALVKNFLDLSDDEQLQIMRDIVEGKDTEYSHEYGALSANNQLLVWYIWAEAMGDTVVDLPEDYESSDTVSEVLDMMEEVEFEKQISLLREMATNMGYSDVKPPQSQEETGKTPSL